MAPVEIYSLPSVKKRPELSNYDGYKFSYLSSKGVTIDVFASKIIVNSGVTVELKLENITSINIVVKNREDLASSSIYMTGDFGSINIPVDTKRKDRYFDVFDVHRAIRKLIWIESSRFRQVESNNNIS